MDRVKLFGRVTVKQDGSIIYEDIPNHWINYGLKGLTSYLCVSGWNGNYTSYGWSGSSTSNGYNMRVGTNTTTVTTFDMSELLTPVVVNPNATMGSNITQVSTGVWHLVFTANWNAGVITQTIGEVGLYLAPFDILSVQGGDSGQKTQRLISRISAADGTFTAFTPDPTKTLTIEWKVGVSF